MQPVRRANTDWLAQWSGGASGRGGQADGGQGEGGRASSRLVGRPIGLTLTLRQCHIKKIVDCLG